MARVTLRVIDGADRGRVYRDVPLPITVGREEGNSIQLNDDRVSRFHLKIQEDKKRFVLTDLDSTNGTKVNGQDTHLHVLNFGDTVGVGRSLLLFGSEDEIRRRLELIEGLDTEGSATLGLQEIVRADEKKAEVELSWHDDPETQAALSLLLPPDPPSDLSAGQAAQVAEILSYLHVRLRKIIDSVDQKAGQPLALNSVQWQSLLDLQAKIAEYLRRVGMPE